MHHANKFKVGEHVRVPFGARKREAVIVYIGSTCYGVDIIWPDGDPIRGLYREEEIEGL